MPWEAEFYITQVSKLRGVCLYQSTLGEIIELRGDLIQIAQYLERQKLEGILEIIIRVQETKAQSADLTCPNLH